MPKNHLLQQVLKYFMNIKLTIDRFEEDKAVLIADNGEQIIWPKNKLPEGIREGAVLVYDIRTDAEAEEEKRKTAKDLLNEILK